MSQALCPHCGSAILRIVISEVSGGTSPTSPQWKCAVYSCPTCRKALSVQIDPIALKNDTVNEINRR